MEVSDYTAATPAAYNKTPRDYLWLLPKSMNEVIEDFLFKLPKSPFIDAETLTKALDYWFGKIMKLTKLIRHDNKGHKYTMRSIRCFRATEWVMKRTECEILGDVVPPNPLQHEANARTIIQNYAKKGADDLFEARKRCWEKYPERMKALRSQNKLILRYDG